VQAEIGRQTVALARALNVVGLMNVQFAIQRNVIYVLEVNPRASRTVPFVSKAIGTPLAKVAARCMVGKSLGAQRAREAVEMPYYAVKEAVFPFIKFPGADTILGPEMKSTGEVMGVGHTFSEAFLKSQAAAGQRLPTSGKVFLSVRNSDKAPIVDVARALARLEFSLFATRGTAAALTAAGIEVTPVNKVAEGRPHVVDMIKNGDFSLIINTVEERLSAVRDSYAIRHAALEARVTYYTTVAGAKAACAGLSGAHGLQPYCLQVLHASLLPAGAKMTQKDAVT
jgi:carbamoyl-phosphate synthase large subunit